MKVSISEIRITASQGWAEKIGRRAVFMVLSVTFGMLLGNIFQPITHMNIMRNSPVYSLKTVYTGLVQRTGYTGDCGWKGLCSDGLIVNRKYGDSELR